MLGLSLQEAGVRERDPFNVMTVDGKPARPAIVVAVELGDRLCGRFGV